MERMQAQLTEMKKQRSEFRDLTASEISAESRAVTFGAMRGVFSLANVRAAGAKVLGGILRSFMPELYASETRRDIVYTSALTNAAAALSEPVKVARIYETIPEVTSADIQVLADLMAKNHGVQLILLVRKPDPQAESKFKKDMTQEILRRRKTSGDAFKGIHLSVTADVEKVAALLEGEQMRGLVYGDEGARELESVSARVRSRNVRNVLMVRNDTGKDDRTVAPASALLAAFERLFDPQAKITEEIVNVSSLLAQYLQLQAIVAQLVGKSA